MVARLGFWWEVRRGLAPMLYDPRSGLGYAVVRYDPLRDAMLVRRSQFGCVLGLEVWTLDKWLWVRSWMPERR